MNGTAVLKTRQQKACEAFIEEARKLPFFTSGHLDFDNFRWNLVGLIKRPTEGSVSKIAFKTLDSIHGRNAQAIPGFLGESVKASVAFKLWETRDRPWTIGAYRKLAQSASHLHRVMQQDGLAEDPMLLGRDHLDRAVDCAGSPGNKAVIASGLGELVQTWAAAGFTPDLEGWTHSMSSPGYVNKHRSRISSQRKRNSLSNDEVFAIAEAFNVAENCGSQSDVLATCLLALLCCAPARVGELSLLPADIEVVENPGAGYCDDDVHFDADIRYHFGLRWWPLKNGPPQIKYVPKELVPVVKEAIRRIRNLTEPARKTARFMLENPGQFPLPDHLRHLRETGEATRPELRELRGITAETNTALPRDIIRLRYGVYCFKSFETWWRTQLPEGWPLVSKISGVTYDTALLISHRFQLDSTNNVDPSRIEIINYSFLANALSGHKNDQPNLFERLGVTLPDGTFPKITTHQIRHYLNTVAQKANVPQAQIARWSGRKLIMQNEDYDHTDLEDVVNDILSKNGGDDIGIVVPKIIDYDADELNYREALVRQSIHSTPFGFCTGDLRKSPCDKAGACVACVRLVCIAGHETQVPNIKADVERRRISVENIRAREVEGRRINPALKEAMEQQLAHGETLLEIITNPTNKGAKVRNSEAPELVNFSHCQRVFDARQILARINTSGKRNGSVE